MKYKIEITETLQRIVEVEAKNLTDAITKIGKDYYSGTVELNADNAEVFVSFEEFKEQNNEKRT